ncbi:aspartate aminotransferase family protein [Acidocella sp.]|uniref:aspartate aminotransferase family protein n=1 Tax=Acidocella sp. TaxID=50710 RepID=UPI002620570F|nr:aspartate aminotransferase family protein [Acidocella sp.]
MSDLIERRRALLSPSYRLFYDRPVQPVRGEGAWLYEADGTRLLDAYNNVVPVGHCHPRVVAAMAAQSALLNTHTRYLHQGILDYSAALLAKFPAALARATFTCTGSEANDLAIRVARFVTGGTGIIVTGNAYHGVTGLTAEISPSLGETVALGAHVRTVPAPAPGVAFGAEVARACADLSRHGIKPALLIVDTVFASDGVFTDPAGVLAPAAAAIRAAGGLFLADEVQPGFGRLGEAFWGFARHGVVPDLVSMGKPMGNGYPVAGLVARPELMAEFGEKIRYFNTFGGNPVAMAAARATLEVIEAEGLQDNALKMGAALRAELSARTAVRAVRGAGLFLGVALESGALASRVVNRMRALGVLISTSGPAGDVLKIRPPLVLSEDQAALLVAAFDKAVADG